MESTTAPKTFNDIQKEYDELYQVDGVRDDDRAYAFHAKKIFELKNDSRKVLDIACGGGYFLREIRDLKGAGNVELYGADISSVALEKAKIECPEAKYLVTVAEDMPFENTFFDTITCLGSMEHFLDIEKALGEMKRIAKDDALFYIMVPNMFWYKDIFSVLCSKTRIQRNQTQERFLTQGEWIELIESGGLKVSQTLKYNGIAKYDWKQAIKDIVIPVRFSYHFIFVCRKI